MSNLNLRKVFRECPADKKDDLINKITTDYAEQTNFFKDKQVTNEGKKVSKKDTVLFVSSWKELTTKQKSLRVGITFSCLLFLFFFSISLHNYKDTKMLTIISSVIVSAISIFLLTCIASHISTIEDRKITAEINETLDGENKFSTTAIRSIIDSIEDSCTKEAFNDYLPEKEVQGDKPKTKLDFITSIKEFFKDLFK